MFKIVLSVALSMIVSIAAAESGQLESNTTKSQNMPVIIKNELINPGLCRLHFEHGASKDIACTSRKY